MICHKNKNADSFLLCVSYLSLLILFVKSFFPCISLILFLIGQLLHLNAGDKKLSICLLPNYYISLYKGFVQWLIALITYMSRISTYCR